ncbi:MAG: nonstructural protein [Arizlama microvirus]|nr:MAG: nonstructural protein [Arizlama microvirus]
MKYIVVCVRDRAADCFGVPVFGASLGSAIRSFTDEINRADPSNQMHKHPDDFDLYSLGVFDDATGDFQCGIPRQVAIGKDLIVNKLNGS